MWFKNASIYKLTKGIDLSVERLEALLNDYEFQGCSDYDMKKLGWCCADAAETTLLHSANDVLMIALKTQEKIIPPTLVNEELKKRLNTISDSDDVLCKKDILRIKEAVIEKLVKQALSRYAVTRCLIIPSRKLLIIDTGSVKKAEELLAFLRKTIGSLPVTPIVSEKPISKTLSAWLSGDVPVPKSFMIGDNVTMTEICEDPARVKITNDDLLDNDEVKSHLAANKLVTTLDLQWNDNIYFRLSDDYSIKSLKFSEEIKEQNEDIDDEDPGQRFDADFYLMTQELGALLTDLFESFKIVQD